MKYRAPVVPLSIIAACLLMSRPIIGDAQSGGIGGAVGGVGAAAGGAGGAVGGATGSTSSAGGSAVGGAGGTVGSVGGTVGSVGGTVGSVGGAVGGATGGTSSAGGSAVGGAGGTVGSVGGAVGSVGGAVGSVGGAVGGVTGGTSSGASDAGSTSSAPAPAATSSGSSDGGARPQGRKYYVTCSTSSCRQLGSSRRATHFHTRPPIALSPVGHDALASYEVRSSSQGDRSMILLALMSPRISWEHGARSSHLNSSVRRPFSFFRAAARRHSLEGNESLPNSGALHDTTLAALKSDPSIGSQPLLKPDARSLQPGLQSTDENASLHALPLDKKQDKTSESGRNPIADLPKPASYDSEPVDQSSTAAVTSGAQIDVADPLIISGADVNLVHDCSGRDVTIAASNSKLFLSGTCRSVTIPGNNDDVLVEISSKGKLLILGQHNSVIWSSRAEGPEPVPVSADQSNTVIHLRSKSEISTGHH